MEATLLRQSAFCPAGATLPQSKCSYFTVMCFGQKWLRKASCSWQTGSGAPHRLTKQIQLWLYEKRFSLQSRVFEFCAAPHEGDAQQWRKKRRAKIKRQPLLSALLSSPWERACGRWLMLMCLSPKTTGFASMWHNISSHRQRNCVVCSLHCWVWGFQTSVLNLLFSFNNRKPVSLILADDNILLVVTICDWGFDRLQTNIDNIILDNTRPLAREADKLHRWAVFFSRFCDMDDRCSAVRPPSSFLFSEK